ncbi:OmpA family protein [Wenzhouxiangella sp. XN79A]|uniref:OmpA family protein n=1 Tax=Wenzhouxiangella sp. XN79A TaxID=2724193 RepID=UPI00144AC1D6|nr:OmpA family protein [Wenzhouxiangella sp. XN79A]NKI35691.1 OmpA family protein [Wenzhouxiangella sp. XN79A]
MTAAAMHRHGHLVVLLALVLALAGCATPTPPPGLIENLQADLQNLLDDEETVALAPVAVAEARTAVRQASIDELDADARLHRVRVARKHIEIARAEAFAERARREAETVEQRRTGLILQAGRLEVERARRQAEEALLESTATREEMQRAQSEALSAEERRQRAAEEARRARSEAEQARRLAEAQSEEIELARREAELATQTADSLRRRLEYMEYRETDRGVVITLGDVLFEIGEADLLPAAQQNLGDVIELLNTEPDAAIRIEGHTDATGPAQLNLRLSEQRAMAVRDALIDLGVDGSRMNAVVGMGEDFPIATNETAEGRARNRRVDVILLNE